MVLLVFDIGFGLVDRIADPSIDNSERAQTHKQDFIDIDLNSDGKLDATEVKEFYAKSNFMMTQEDVNAFFMAADKDETGTISEEEYIYTSLLYDENGLDLNDYKFWLNLALSHTTSLSHLLLQFTL